MLVGLVFAHGGACAAVVMSEEGGHAAHTAQGPHRTSVWRGEECRVPEAPRDTGCHHRDLPSGHRHGTEGDCSAVVAAGSGSPSEAASLPELPSSPTARGPRARHDGSARQTPGLLDLCVMRI
ncbi:hypothetical protein GCM10017600_56640 [Streptosporangium carneum]|uniref:Uncharacterized protein n=1 Tax=Streptosporangium carneum TaxID=47481 RepID=A0A9W6I543_9ACTN|nr:hypothetical protein GCM10017600_56640 [Streptosporangium carneum]